MEQAWKGRPWSWSWYEGLVPELWVGSGVGRGVHIVICDLSCPALLVFSLRYFYFLIPNIFCIYAILSNLKQAVGQDETVLFYLLCVVKADLRSYCEQNRGSWLWCFSYFTMKHLHILCCVSTISFSVLSLFLLRSRVWSCFYPGKLTCSIP